MKIRKYRDTDRDEVINLWHRVFPDPAPRNEPDRVIDLKLAIDDMILVAIQDKKLIGTTIAGYDGHRGWLYSVAVDPDYRNNGIGRKLVESAVDLLKQHGCIKVNLQVLPGNHEVTGFYEAIGFEIEDRISMGKLLDT